MTSKDLQRTLEASLGKRTKDTFGPPIGKHLAVFIDDMNVPQPDRYSYLLDWLIGGEVIPRLLISQPTLVLNIFSMNRFGTQQPIALLKILFDKGGMFGRDKDLGWKKLKDMVYLAAMGTVEGGRHDVDPRFLSHFAVYNVLAPNDNTIIYIYQSILKGHFSDFETELLPMADMLVESTVKLFNVNDISNF